MLYAEIAGLFDRLESTTSRLEMADILASFFKGLSPNDLRSVVYMTQGKIHADFIPQKFDMADKLILRAIADTSRHDVEDVEKLFFQEGDIGTVAELMIADKKQTSLFSEPLTLDRVMNNLELIETVEGRGSQQKKMRHLVHLLHDSDPLSARYICRIVSGKMRLGAASMTILDALASSFASKEERPYIERGYNITSDMGQVAHNLAVGGIESVRNMHVCVGNPLRVMLAERLPTLDGILQKMGGSCALEYKYDGVRMQAHIDKDDIVLYSRRLENISSHFPDVIASLRSSFQGQTAIVEGECAPINEETGRLLPFQEVSHRRRKHGLKEAILEYPVSAFLFDCLYLNGEDMIELPYMTRRKALIDHFPLSSKLRLTEMSVVSDAQQAHDFFESALMSGCEGVMAKSLSEDSGYQAGSRGFHWIKFKKDYHSDLTDTLDLVIIGGFHGKGKRKGHYGALLMATYNTETAIYSSVCKLGSGFDDSFLAEMPSLLDHHLSPSKPPDVDSRLVPDVWFQPAVVLEVLATEISVSPIHTAASEKLDGDSGLALRFPRFTGRVRDDKGPDQSSSSEELWNMYILQSPEGGEPRKL